MKRLIAVIFYFLAYGAGFGNAFGDEKDTLKESIERQIQKDGFSKDEVGIWIGLFNGSSATLLYENNGQKRFIPASLTKIATSAAVLDALQPGFQFHTQLLSSSPTQAGVLKGNLFLKGGGDPAFVSEKMWFLVNEFVREGITTVEGDLVVDESRFDSVRIDSSRDNQRVDRAYDAPVGAISFNWNSTNIFVRPSPNAGAPAIIISDPKNDYIEIINKTKTSGKTKSIEVQRRFVQGHDQMIVTGSIPLGHKEVVIYRGISDPALWSGYNLLEFLKQRNIKVQGRVIKGVTPEGARLVADCPSERIEAIIVGMNKFSNNFVSEMLTKNLAVELGRQQGTIAAGLKHVEAFVRKCGVASDAFQFENPSGLSHQNYISPTSLGALLICVRNQFSLFPEFMSSLPIGGVDGTLKSRDVLFRRVRAKTGMLNGVLGLAGFAQHNSGHQIAFVLLFNGPDRKVLKAKDLTDRILANLLERPILTIKQ